MGELRLAIDASASRVGGGLSRVRELAETLLTLGPEHEYVFAMNASVASQVSLVPPRSHRILVPPLMAAAPLRMLWEHFALPPALSRFDVNWILGPFGMLPLGPGLDRAVRRAVILSSIQPFVAERARKLGGYQAARLRILRSVILHSLDQADVVFVLSDEALRVLGPRLESRELVRLPMAPPNPAILDEASRLQLPDVATGPPFLIAAGDLLAHKGIEDAISAVGLLSQRQFDVRLLICGNPVDSQYSKYLRELASRKAPGTALFLHGLGQAKILALMRSAAVTTICARFENTSRVPIEAMAVGSPIIAVDVPISRETCGDAALYYPAGDADALSEQIIRVLSDSVLRAELQSRGRHQLRDRDWLSATRAILAALETS